LAGDMVDTACGRHQWHTLQAARGEIHQYFQVWQVNTG
jgi:hypothetical protein